MFLVAKPAKIDPEVFHKKASESEWSVVQIIYYIDKLIWFWNEELKELQIEPSAI